MKKVEFITKIKIVKLKKSLNKLVRVKVSSNHKLIAKFRILAIATKLLRSAICFNIFLDL